MTGTRRSARTETDEFGKTLYAKTAEADRKVVERVAEIAAARRAAGAGRAGLAAAQAVVTAPIVGATKPQHLEDAVAALSVKLTPEEIAELEEPYVPHAVVGFA